MLQNQNLLTSHSPLLFFFILGGIFCFFAIQAAIFKVNFPLSWLAILAELVLCCLEITAAC